MSRLRQAAEQALKYFEDAHGLEDTEVAIKEALREALAEPANSTTDFVEPKASPQTEQEPVAFYIYKPTLPHGNLGNVADGNLPWVYDQDPSSGYSARMLVYTAPPKREWVGLTADEIWKCNKAKAGSAVEFHICSAHQNVLDFAEALEAKLKQKNEPA